MNTPETIPIGTEKQLFIDERWFASQRGMKLTVNPPRKCERVLRPDTPWEGFGIHAYSSVVEHDGMYHMFYDAFAASVPAGQPARSTCYARSADGIHWEKPNVGPFVWNGIKENNLVLPGCTGGVIVDENGPDETRFKALCIVDENSVWPETKGALAGGGGFVEIYLCTSPNGIHWKRHTPCALPFFHDSQNVICYDPRLKKYVAFVRWSIEMQGRSVARVAFDDPLDLPWPFKDRPETTHGPGFSRHRAGDELPEVIKCDTIDPPATDLYTPGVTIYPWAQEAYLSFTTPYRHYPVGDTSDTTLEGKDERGRRRNDGPIEIQLAVSRDGISWSRPDRQPYVPLGLAGSSDAGQVYMALGMIKKGDEIFQYYAGIHSTHGYEMEEIDHARTGLCRLVQRLDGFISADAAYTGAEFTTPVVTFSGAHLKLNANCSALGEIWVEIRDEQNRPIPGYTLSESISVERNHIAAPVFWKERENVGELMGRPVRLHIVLRACKLYAFQFEDKA
ncbi:MAG: hypothetical protein V1800_15875 [Candidatus Latescibacterota bacterium]